jgi:hypothetical protein
MTSSLHTQSRPFRARRYGALFGAALLPMAFLAGTAPPALANAPGNPGTPSAPAVLYTEGFENNTAGSPELLTAYTGAAPLDETYTADPAWVAADLCDGYIVSEQDPATPPAGSDCGTGWAPAKELSSVLGTWSGADAATNHALVGYTQGNPGAGTELETAIPVPLAAANRFLVLGTDAAAQNCQATHPLYQLYLLNGSAAQPSFSTPVDPCAKPGTVIDDTAVGTYVGDQAELYSGTSAGIQLVNEQASGAGNDAAVDNIRLLDVTPQLDLSGTAGAVPVGTPADLTFTVTNTSELDAKDGWSFTATLPPGLDQANSAVTTTCASGAATPGSVSGTLQVSGDLSAGQPSCTVTVQVTSILGGSYQLCAAQTTALVGLDPPGCTTLTFTAPVFDARADSALLTSPILDLGPLVPASYQCTAAPGANDNSAVSAGLGAVGDLGALASSASGTIAADGTRTAAASDQTAGLSLLAGLITADVVSTTAQAQQPLTTSGPGTVTVSGSTTFTNLRIGGVAIAANPGPDTTISLPLVGSVVLNQQTAIAGGDGITVNALHISLLTGTQLTIATSTSALLSADATCPVS